MEVVVQREARVVRSEVDALAVVGDGLGPVSDFLCAQPEADALAASNAARGKLEGELGEARAGEVLTVLGRCLPSREAHGGQVLRLLSCAS